MAREQPLASAATMPMTAIPVTRGRSRGRWLSRQLQRQVGSADRAHPRLRALFAAVLLDGHHRAQDHARICSPIRPLLWPTELAWSNFRDAVEYIPFWQYLRNTSIITALTIIGSVISNPIIAYGFSRIEWPGRDQIFYLVLATVFIPFPVLIVALFDIFAKTAAPAFSTGGSSPGRGTGSTPICRWWCRCSSATPSGSFSCGSS